MKNTKFYIFFLFLIIFSIIFLSSSLNVDAKRRKKRVKTVNLIIKNEEVKKDSILADGVIYQNLWLGDGKDHFSVHLLKVAIHNDKNQVFIGKSGNNIAGLTNFLDYLELENPNEAIYGMVNGSFWSAYNTHPIGSTFIQGEILVMNQYKKWSSLFFDKHCTPYIDYFDISGTIFYKNYELPINYTNKRRDSLGLAYYNHFYGDTIPFVKTRSIERAIDSAYKEWFKDMEEFLTDDDTELKFDTLSYIEEIKASLRQSQLEAKTRKYLCEYLEHPIVNKSYKVIVRKYSDSLIEIPKNHCVVSLGLDFPPFINPQVGDTISVLFQTNIYQNIEFYCGLSGTPSIANDGVYLNKAQSEGSTGRRFINSQLTRTLVGYDKNKDTLYLIAVAGTNSANKQFGANMKDLEKIAKHFKMYDAINLDGGGSTTFVLGKKNIIRSSNPTTSRKLSVFLGVKKRK